MAALIALTAVGASLPGVRNQFAQDDVPLVQDDLRVRQLTAPIPILTGTYWPPPHGEFLYRPLTTATLAIQWALGGGAPIAFRIGSYLLYAATAVALFLFASSLLSPVTAFAVALLFAAHPVHVEAVALAVNQAEIWVGLLAILMTATYLRQRRTGWIRARGWAALAAYYLAACLLKENALVIPGILMAAEILLVPGPRLQDRVRHLWRGYAAVIAVGLAFMLLRTAVVGDVAGTFAAEALAGQGIGGRILTMLQVVPEWLRLMVWPAHLRGDYSPGIIEQATAWGMSQTLGALILAGAMVLGALLYRQHRTVTFGMLWFAIGVFPVSNILIPTGIVLAERTLFLPSIGFLLMAGGLAEYLLTPRLASRRVRAAVLVGTVALVAAGSVRSGMRHTVYRDQAWYWAQTVEFDAPLSYRAHLAFAQLLFGSGLEARSILHYQTAMALYPPAWWIRNNLADQFRAKGRCDPALDLYAESLRIDPDQSGARASRIACYLHLGQYQLAREEAEAALLRGKDLDDFRGFLQVADSAARVGAPAGTVQLIIRDVHARW